MHNFRRSQDYKDGYQAAVEAIRKQEELGKSGSQAADDANNDLTNPNNPNSQGNGSSQDSQDPTKNGEGSGKKSRTSKSDENQGVVRDEDCIGPDQLDNTPDTPGTMIDKSEGDKIAEQEGYDKEGGNEDRLEQEWKDEALKAAKKMSNKPGKNAGYSKLQATLERLYKPTKDWKKELKKVVGYSISPEDTRQAYANKNVLITQNRIARTDKAKYDSLDYIIAFIDSSGSMQDDQLKLCLSEVYQIALQKKPLNIWIIQCDTLIQDIQMYSNVNQLKKSVKNATVKGRGGTDFKACWDLLKTDKRFKGRQAELVMLFTDGYCAQYKRDPRTMSNLCWVLLDNPGFNLQYKEAKTKAVFLNTSDIK